VVVVVVRRAERVGKNRVGGAERMIWRVCVWWGGLGSFQVAGTFVGWGGGVVGGVERELKDPNV